LIVEEIESILSIEKPDNSRYLLKSQEKAEVSVGWRKRLILTHNPKVRGSNPLPATKENKGLTLNGRKSFFVSGLLLGRIF